MVDLAQENTFTPDESNVTDDSNVISASSARFQALLFNVGNLLSMLPGFILAPIILLTDPQHFTMIIMFIIMIVPPILWFGVSMMIYAITRHHPNARVGHYVQQAAYRYYGLFGAIIPIGTFYGTAWELWIITGGVISIILIPWSVFDIYKIVKEPWEDVKIPSSK